MKPSEIRPAAIADLTLVTDLLAELYDAHDYAELREENEHHLTDDTQVILLAYDGAAAVGIAHAAVRREYVEGRFDNLPIGYLEAIFVVPDYRLRGIARALVAACEQWAKVRGCSAFASDCELDNTDSLHFHECVGFRETSRNIHFIKEIVGVGVSTDLVLTENEKIDIAAARVLKRYRGAFLELAKE